MQEELECQIEWDVSIHQPLKMVSLKQIRDNLARHGPQSDFHPISQVKFRPCHTPVHRFSGLSSSSSSGTTWLIMVLSQTSTPLAR
jgi:hypothetical protein